MARDPYLEVVFEIAAGDMYDTFSKRMWEASDITLALNGSVGTEVSIDWIYKDDDPKSHYYYADMLIEKTDDHLYKVSFCGYGSKHGILNSKPGRCVRTQCTIIIAVMCYQK